MMNGNNVMVEQNLEEFLKLPDWKKIELKRKKKYKQYPLQTKEQHSERVLKLFKIQAHFLTVSDIDNYIDYVMNNRGIFGYFDSLALHGYFYEMLNSNTVKWIVQIKEQKKAMLLDKDKNEPYDIFPANSVLWPMAMDLFLTPKLLDVIPKNLLFKFCNCYCCENFIGYNKRDYRRIKRNKVVPISGHCSFFSNEKQFIRKKYKTDLSSFLVSPHEICPNWNPLLLYEKVLDFKIKDLFAKNKTKGYQYEDYQKDLKVISMYDYYELLIS